MKRIIARSNYYLPLLLFFLLADVLCDSVIFKSFNKQNHSVELFLFMGILLLQAISAPIQAGFSDFSCRKKSLMVSLSFSLIALVFAYLYSVKILFYFPVLILMLLIKGMLGNTTPLSWAAIADTQEKNVRFSFALSTGALAVGYLLMILANKFLSEQRSSLIITLFLFALVLLCAVFFKDIRDKTEKKDLSKMEMHQRWILIINDIKHLFNELKDSRTRNALLAFLLWEISIYCILLLYIDFGVDEFSSIALGMVFGYLFGVLLLKFLSKIKDKTIIRLGFNISAISLVPFFINIIFSTNVSFPVLSFCYFFHMLGNAFLSATLFAVLAKERKSHEQGKIYGLIESVDIIAFLISAIAAIVYNAYHLNLAFIIGLSFLTITVSWFPYAKYEKTRARTR